MALLNVALLRINLSGGQVSQPALEAAGIFEPCNLIMLNGTTHALAIQQSTRKVWRVQDSRCE